MIDHNLVNMTQVSKQQQLIDEEKQRKQIQKKDTIQMSAYSTKYVDDMIEINENEIDHLKQKINQTMSNFDEKIHLLQKKNEINIAENFKDIIISLSLELEKMTKLVDSFTNGQGLTTQNQLKTSIQIIKEYKDEYQKVYDAFLKVSRENKQWNIKVHTLRDRVREFELITSKQEQYIDFFKKKYSINIDNELAKLQQIEKEKNITLMEDIKVYLNKNNGQDNEPSTYQKFIKNFIFDKYTFTILDLFLETDKLIQNLKKQYQFQSPSAEKTQQNISKNKIIGQQREQRAENYYYQLFVKCVNELKNSQVCQQAPQKQEQANQVVEKILLRNTMLQIDPEELLKLFLNDNNVQQLIRKHVFSRQSQLHQISNNSSILNQTCISNSNNLFLNINSPSSTINNKNNLQYNINNIQSMDDFQQSLTTNANSSHYKHQSRRQNIDYFSTQYRRISAFSKPESPVVSKDRSLVGSGGQLPSPIQTPSLQNKVRVSSELGNRECQQQYTFRTSIKMKSKTRTPQNLQNNLSINTQDESFDANQNGQQSNHMMYNQGLNSSRQQQQSSSNQQSIREIEIINNYLSSLNPRWKHNPTSNEKLKAQTQQTRFFQTQNQRFSPTKQMNFNNF
ncbi:hypothetical protein ABPG72_012911 [Tetrahymena utriculariae]